MSYWGTPSHHNPRKQIGGQPPIVPYGEDEDTPAALRRVLRTPESPPSSPSNSFTKFLHSKELKLALVALLSLVLATISLYTIFSLSPASHASRFERPATGYPPVPSKVSELSTAQVLADVTEKATATVHTEMLFQLQTELETRQLKNDAALAAGLAGVERKGEDRALALDVSLRAQADRIATLEKQLAAAQAAQAAPPKVSGVRVIRTQTAATADTLHGTRAAAAAAAEAAAAETAAGVAATATAAPAAPSPVEVAFVFDGDARLGAEVHLYWLSGNATERLYARLPAGKRVYETTYAGQCWRARDPISGNHVASYCATAEPHQTVRLGASDDVDIDFHFARTRKLGQHARVVRVGPPSRVAGEVAQGAHLTVRAKAGERFKVVGSAAPTARAAAADATVVDAEIVLLEMTARAEAEQHVNIGSNVTLRFELPSDAAAAHDVFWVWDDAAFAAEHLYGSVAAGGTLSAPTVAGEEWIVREKGGAEVLRVVSTDDKVQRVPIAARKREAAAPSAPSSLLTAEQRKAATAPATSPAATGAAKVEEKPKPSLRTRLMGAK